MHAAAQTSDLAQIAALVGAKADLNVRDAYGRAPLHVATFARQRAAIRALIVAGADPLTLARARRYAAMVELLENAGGR